MYNRENAPISQRTWNEMEEELRGVFENYLTGRRVFHVDGPKGVNFTAVSEGRLEEANNKDGIGYSKYKVKPLIEIRKEFTLSRWELDNILRGAKDVDYEPLTDAAKKIALFEEEAIFNGFEDGDIEGVIPSSGHDSIEFGDDMEEIMEALVNGVIKLKESFVDGPYTLIVGREAYRRILSEEKNYPLESRIRKLIGGDIVYNHVIDGAILVPVNHEDLELTIGQDLDLGYQSHTNTDITFFITESFTFRVLDEDLIVNYYV